jgi:acyl-CoA synthetase (AMP-forming)/AMP-acid ligase II
VSLAGAISDKLFTARTLVRAGIVTRTHPRTIARAAHALRAFGPTPAAGYTVNALRLPGRPAIIDERGTVTFGEVHARTNALAHALADEGVRQGDVIAIMCRNHRGFVESTIACSKLGVHHLFLNTAFAAPQVSEVIERERPVAVIHDEEFAPLFTGPEVPERRYVAWREDAGPDGPDRITPPVSLEDLIARGDRSDVTPPSDKGRMIILTSGTTGTPKGARRRQPDSLEPAAALFDRIPLRARERTLIAAPLFHSWGFVHFTIAMPLGSTLVLRRRFDPEDTLRTVAEHRCTALIVVPVMLQRMLELPEERLRRHDLSSLRIVALSGSALPGDLALAAMDRFGDVLYNLYGSTEVAWATIATPQDLREAPGTAGRPPRGTLVRLLDEQGREVGPGETGRIFVGNDLKMEGYTGGGGRELVHGLMSSGDVGRFDEHGRLFIAGRDDEMIVSGGENVFPREVEDLLAGHEAVQDVAVVGVPDEEFGQRLTAYVVLHPGCECTGEELREHVRRNLARFKVPRDVHFLEELPRNATGKVLKRVLGTAREGA